VARASRRPRPAGRAGVDPRLLVLAAATLWGTTGTARALGPDEASPTAVGAARLIVGGACLVAVAALGGPGAARSRSSAGVGSGGDAGTRMPLVVAAVAMAAYQPLFFGGVARTGVAVGTVVGIGSSPVFAGVLGMTVRGERPGGRWMGATGLALAGTALLVGTGGGDDVDPGGVGLALGAGLAYAVYVLASKLALDGGRAPDALTVSVFALAGLLLVPVALVAGVSPLLDPGGLLMVAHLGVVTVAVAYVLFSRGLHGVGVGAAGTLTLAEPATAAVLGVVLVGERLGGTTVAGIALIAAGLMVLVAGVRSPGSARGRRGRRVVGRRARGAGRGPAPR
jgi:drug/metabolite transporter, DME family